MSGYKKMRMYLVSNIVNDSIKEQILDEVYEELLEKGWSEDSAAEMAPDIAQKRWEDYDADI